MILSIQSHVAFGRVGNRAAVFPLELLGHDVVAVNTVQFSNHTGYGSWRGTVFGADHIREVIRGVDEAGALGVDAVLSGYMGDTGTGRVILETVDRVRAIRPDSLYCLDPVMGDSVQGFFVRAGIPELIRDEALPRATIVKPNHFEAEFLSGMKIGSLADAKKAGESIRSRGPTIVLITSFTAASASDTISMYLSTDAGDWIITTDRLSLNPEPNGGGDLSAALFLGWYLLSGTADRRDARRALEQTANSVYAVYDRTRAAGTRELALVASRFDIMNPPNRYLAEPV